MTILSSYKRYLLILISSLIILSCADIQEEKNYLVQSEQIVDSIYFNTFNSPIELEENPNPIRLYKSIEDYYIFIGVLKTRDKEGYKTMYNLLLGHGSIIDLECLYKHFPETQLLTMPSNVALNLYSFEKAVEAYEGRLPKESSMLKAYTKLQKISDGIDINFDKKLFEDYIDSIETTDFEDKFIYRIPLLAYSHILISEGSISPKSPNRHKHPPTGLRR